MGQPPCQNNGLHAGLLEGILCHLSTQLSCDIPLVLSISEEVAVMADLKLEHQSCRVLQSDY